MKKKRYIAQVEIVIWANDDKEAIKDINGFCEKQVRDNDNDCQVIELVEQPFGTIGNRDVEI